MTTADLLSRILELAQAGLDDPTLSGQALADRAHLSRFHFDRVVSAAAGEPPGALRRRLLLERAAYRLLDRRNGRSRRTVLDVAVEAGYGSHEAFTRAFRRAYGRSPTELRAAPPHSFRELELAGASGVHFQPPGGLRLPSTRTETHPMTATDILQQLTDHHVHGLSRLLEQAAGLDDAVLDRPIEVSVETVDSYPDRPASLRDVLNAMVTQEEHWLSALRGGDWPDESDRSASGLRARHAVAGAGYQAFVARSLAEDDLAELFLDTTCDPPETHSVGGTIAHVITFGAVRRTMAAGAMLTAGLADLDDAADPRPYVDGVAAQN